MSFCQVPGTVPNPFTNMYDNVFCYNRLINIVTVTDTSYGSNFVFKRINIVEIWLSKYEYVNFYGR